MNSLDCKSYLQKVYQNLKADCKKNVSISETYGEILFESVCQILEKIRMNSSDVLVDLGSGLGKVVLQLMLQTNIKTLHGIEIQADLHCKAMQALEKICDDFKDLNSKRVQLSCGNFLDFDWQDASIILIGSPCFTPKMLNEITKKIAKYKKIHTIISLRPLLYLQHFRCHEILKIECSWDSALCYIYESEFFKTSQIALSSKPKLKTAIPNK